MRCEGPSSGTNRSSVYDRTALRGFKGTATFYLEICSNLRDFCSTGRPSAEQLIEAAEYLSGQVGVTCHAWSQACVVLGRLQAAVAVIVYGVTAGAGRGHPVPGRLFPLPDRTRGTKHAVP
ncbi:replication initiation protein RepC [Gluconobacter oxydans]|uniref:replication initiation protein RepC n=1 Tax=Gluconobacter oxydans TaxID=442 RepID=UPI0026499C4D|nr:replication initiation protein RepC [Gluconobacter oxydans]WKE49616.1 replication initiation protein RepC [Gluconobacter oxydans]